MSLLTISNLSVSLKTYSGTLKPLETLILNNLSLTINQGEIVAIVGASGAGKSILAHSILGLLPKQSVVTGELHYRNIQLNEKSLKKLRGNQIALIPQSISHLNPLMPVGRQVQQAVRTGDPVKEQQRVFEVLDLPQEAASQYPHQLSGGMARRVLVATALVSGASLLIADEPTPGLHEEIIHETMSTFQQLALAGAAILLITHDLAAAARIAHSVAVLHEGRLIDHVPASHLLDADHSKMHPYTRALWQALPQHQFTDYREVSPFAGS